MDPNNVLTLARALVISALGICLFVAALYGVVMAGRKGNIGYAIRITIACAIALIPAGIVLGYGWSDFSTDTVDVIFGRE